MQEYIGKKVSIDRSQLTEMQNLCCRDMAEGKQYEIVGFTKEGEIGLYDYVAIQDSVTIVDDAGDEVSIWAVAPGVTIS